MAETGPQPDAGAATRRPRIGVVITELGIPSEIWAYRQCLAMRRVEPVLFSWRTHAPAPTWGAGVESHLFEGPFEPPNSLWRRVGRKLGRPGPLMPPRALASLWGAQLLGAGLDGVLCHFAWNAIPIARALAGRLPLVAQVHGRDVSALLRHASYRRALAETLPRLDHLVAVGTFQIETLRPLGLGARHSVIPCGAPLAAFAARPPPTRAPDGPLRFITVGRISHEKGALETLAAFEAVHAEFPRAEWVAIGDGPLMAELRAAVDRSPAGAAVRLAGWMPPEQVAEELAAAHVFLQHSLPFGDWVEGFGVSLTEAGASGLPIVASRFGGIVDQLEDGRNGFLHAPGDVAGQAAAMGRLAGDEALRQRLGAAARTLAGRFDSDLMTAKLEDVLLDAVARRAAPGAP